MLSNRMMMAASFLGIDSEVISNSLSNIYWIAGGTESWRPQWDGTKWISGSATYNVDIFAIGEWPVNFRPTGLRIYHDDPDNSDTNPASQIQLRDSSVNVIGRVNIQNYVSGTLIPLDFDGLYNTDKGSVPCGDIYELYIPTENDTTAITDIIFEGGDPYSPKYIPTFDILMSLFFAKATNDAGASYAPWRAFSPLLSFTGVHNNTSWVGTKSDNKLNVDLGHAKYVTRIILENGHINGGNTNLGIRNFIIYGTNSRTAYENTTYADLTDLTELGTFEAAQHVASDVKDPQIFVLTTPGTFRYFVFRIADNWGDGANMVVRYIELQSPNIEQSLDDVVFDINTLSELVLSDDRKVAVSLGSYVGSTVKANKGISSGLRYFEMMLLSGGNGNRGIGVALSTAADGTSPGRHTDSSSWAIEDYDGGKWHDNVKTSSYISNPNVGDVIGVAVNANTGKIWFSLNNVWVGDPVAGIGEAYNNISGTVYPMISHYLNNQVTIANFKDSDFIYTPPTGFTAIT